MSSAPASQPMVLVLGHRGVIGKVLLQHLSASGFEVAGASRAECDLLSRDSVDSFLGSLPGKFHVVFAAVINRWVEDSFLSLSNNLKMVEHFMSAARDRVQNVVYLSSVDVYGRSPKLPVREDTALKPESYYAVAKMASECLFRSCYGANRAVSVIRLPGVYGSDRNENSIVGRFLRSIMTGIPMTIRGTGAVRRDFVHVRDVSEIVHRLLKRPFDGSLNIATGVSESLMGVIRSLGGISGRVPLIEYAEPDPQVAGDLEFDTRLLREVFPDFNPTSFGDGARSFIGEFRTVEPAREVNK